MNDLNNFCGADRKLVINDTYEFWVHDAALISNSNYFKEILYGNKKSTVREEVMQIKSKRSSNNKKGICNKPKLNIDPLGKSTINKIDNWNNIDNLGNSNKNLLSDPNAVEQQIDNIFYNDDKNKGELDTKSNKIPQVAQNKESDKNSNIINSKTIVKTFIYVPHHEFFFDILTWIYSKDVYRLALGADEPESFLSILNLGIFLEMNDIFFKALLEKCQIKMSEELFNNQLWSRFSFTFDVLKILIKLIPEKEQFKKITACLAWLKENNTLKQSKSEHKVQEREFELLTSKEFFLVKNFLAQEGYLNFLSVWDLYSLKNKFPRLTPALDIIKIIENFIEQNPLKIRCRICKKVDKYFICYTIFYLNLLNFSRNPVLFKIL